MKSLPLLVLFASACLAENPGPLLFRSPALGKTRIVFAHAGDLWSVSREGGEAVRLTAGAGVDNHEAGRGLGYEGLALAVQHPQAGGDGLRSGAGA